MTLPARLASLTYKSTSLQRADLSVHLDIVEGLNDGVDVRGIDTVIPGLEGVTPRSRKRGARHIQLLGVIQAVGMDEDARLADWQDLLDELEVLFDPSAAAGTLEGIALDGTTRSISCRVEQGGFIRSPQDVWGVDTISVALIAHDPDWSITPEGS